MTMQTISRGSQLGRMHHDGAAHAPRHCCAAGIRRLPVPTRDLMKKGLRLLLLLLLVLLLCSNERPDEEGIKTFRFSTMLAIVRSNERPDEEGIKTSRMFHRLSS